jgi:hypothetical protein
MMHRPEAGGVALHVAEGVVDDDDLVTPGSCQRLLAAAGTRWLLNQSRRRRAVAGDVARLADGVYAGSPARPSGSPTAA